MAREVYVLEIAGPVVMEMEMEVSGIETEIETLREIVTTHNMVEITVANEDAAVFY